MFLINCDHVKYKFSLIKNILWPDTHIWYLPKMTGLWCVQLIDYTWILLALTLVLVPSLPMHLEMIHDSKNDLK